MQRVKSFKVEEIVEHFKEKKRMKRNVESATVRDILTRNAEAPAVPARR